MESYQELKERFERPAGDAVFDYDAALEGKAEQLREKAGMYPSDSKESALLGDLADYAEVVGMIDRTAALTLNGEEETDGAEKQRLAERYAMLSWVLTGL